MESHQKSANAENNLYNASYRSKIARQSKTLEAHVPPPQNHIRESVLACIWPLLTRLANV